MEEEVTPVWAMTRRATFQPTRTDNLNPRVLGLVGRTLDWQGMWRITEEDGGPYVGQIAWQPIDESCFRGWVPDEDLVDALSL